MRRETCIVLDEHIAISPVAGSPIDEEQALLFLTSYEHRSLPRHRRNRERIRSNPDRWEERAQQRHRRRTRRRRRPTSAQASQTAID